MNQKERIVINTFSQYVRIIVVAIIMLYSTRLVLNQLGTSDFGLYSLVGSALAFLSFVSTALTRTVQRFLSYYLGKSDLNLQRKVLFNGTLLNILATIVTVVIILLCEDVFFTHFTNIPKDSIEVAKTLYLLLTVSMIISINVSSINAVFVAHENIIFSSFITILVAVFKLISAIFLSYVLANKLLVYASLMAIISVLEIIIFYVVGFLKYEECRGFLRLNCIDLKLIKSLGSFALWNIYGTLCILIRIQGYAFIINKYISLVGNAAYGIATQISGQINNLVYSLSNAISPVIIKSEGENDSNKMIAFSIQSSKYTFLLYGILFSSILFLIDPILQLWLENVPQYTDAFVISLLLSSLLDSIALGFRTGMQAIGNIKWMTIIVSTLKMLSIPCSILMFLSNCSTYLIFVPYILSDMLGSLFTIIIFCRLKGIRYFSILKMGFINALFAISLMLIACSFVPHFFTCMSILNLIIALFISFVIAFVIAGVVGLSKNEKTYIFNYAKSKFK